MSNFFDARKLDSVHTVKETITVTVESGPAGLPITLYKTFINELISLFAFMLSDNLISFILSHSHTGIDRPLILIRIIRTHLIVFVLGPSLSIANNKILAKVLAHRLGAVLSKRDVVDVVHRVVIRHRGRLHCSNSKLMS